MTQLADRLSAVEDRLSAVEDHLVEFANLQGRIITIVEDFLRQNKAMDAKMDALSVQVAGIDKKVGDLVAWSHGRSSSNY